MTPAARREAVAHLKESLEVSERRACTMIAADRSVVRYRSRRPDDQGLRNRLRELADQRGTVRNSVCGRAADHQAIALVKRSPKMTANCALAIAHARGGMVPSFSALFKTRNRSFVAASSLGK